MRSKKKVLFISTTSNLIENSTSFLCLVKIYEFMKANYGIEGSFIDAARIHIVENLSCYANGGSHCASYEAGPYRCWAHLESIQDPLKYGGVDQMPVIYDSLLECDAVIFGTSVRWMSHSAVLQKVIERLNTLENRKSVYKEKNPLEGKSCGIVVTGQHYQAQKCASHLFEVFSMLGFKVSPDAQFSWQRSFDLSHEQEEKTNQKYLEKYLSTEQGKEQIRSFVESLMNSL